MNRIQKLGPALILFLSFGVVSSVSANEACGEVSIGHKPSETKYQYPAYIIRIDGKGVIERPFYKLPVGKHVIDVHEMISDPMLTRRKSGIQKAKSLEIEVQANKTYHVAAKFDIKSKHKSFKEEYWMPIVWKVTDNECK